MSEGKEFRLEFNGIKISGASSSFEGGADFGIDLPPSEYPVRPIGTPMVLKVEVSRPRWYWTVSLIPRHWAILNSRRRRYKNRRMVGR